MQALAFKPQSEALAVASDDQAWIRAVDSSNKGTPRSFSTRVFALAYSPDGQHIATGSERRIVTVDDKEEEIWEVVVWDTTTEQEVQRLRHGNAVRTVAYSPDGRHIATGDERRVTVSDEKKKEIWEAVIWDVSTGQPVRRLLHEERVNAVAYSGNGEYLATGSEDGTARVFRTRDYTEFKPMTQRSAQESTITTGVITSLSQPVRTVVLDDEGKHLATGSTDLTARVWEVSSGRELARIIHQAIVSGVAFSGDGKRVISVAEDDKANTAWVWDTASGQAIIRIAHEQGVNGVAFSPDDKFIATASTDQFARVWRWQPDALAQAACIRLQPYLDQQEGLLRAEVGDTCRMSIETKGLAKTR